MKKIIITLFTVCNVIFTVNLNAQNITTNPEFPVAALPVTLTFDATGTDLEGYTGDLYTHTGVTTAEGGQWQHVIGSWGNNTTQPQLTRISGDIYELVISPSINDFYGVNPGTETVTEMCFVFRSSDGGTQSSDLFVDVYPENLDITITEPDTTKIYSLGEQINVQAVSLAATSMTLFINEVELFTSANNNLSYTHTIDLEGVNTIRITATDGTNTSEKTTSFFVRNNNNVADLPQADLKDGINYIDDNTVTLVLYAPNKSFCFVKGSFDNWDLGTDNQMNITPDGNKYWITLSGLTAGQEYIYQYIIDGEIYIADPYTDKILDPWNDQSISNSTYPNLISYPTGKASGIVSVFQTAQADYQWTVTNFTRPAPEDLVIYELLIRDFIAAHDYSTLIDTLSYLNDLGVNAIELMPVNEFEGNSSWGYNPSFYFAPDKYYGPKNDLKAFIDSCHSSGIAVIMDIVLNHSYGQSPLVQMYFDPNAGDWGQPSPDNPWYNESSPNSAYSWGYDFNHESQDTKDFIDRVNSYWLTEYKFDGFRFDFTKGFTNTPGDGWQYDAARIAILKRMADEIWNTSSDAYIILEHFAENSEEKELSDYGMMLWGNVNYSYSQASMGWTNEWDFSWVSSKTRGWTNPYLVGYMESHDEERMMFRNLNYGNSNSGYDVKDSITAKERAELAACFFITIPGPKMIWQFEELGYDISIEDPCRVCEKPIKWDYYNEEKRFKLYSVFKELIKLRKDHNVFKTDNYTLNLSGQIKQIVLQAPDMNVVILGNFGLVENTFTASFPFQATWFEFFTGEEYTNTSNTITLQAGEYRIYTDVQLTQPSLLSAPEADSVSVNGEYIVGEILTGNYNFFDADDDTEAFSEYKWYSAAADNGADTKEISGANTKSFELTETEAGRYIAFEVTPVADSDDFPTGEAVKSKFYGPVNKSDLMINPNLILFGEGIFYNVSEYETATIYSIDGRMIEQYTINGAKNINVNYTNMRTGMYIVNFKKGNTSDIRKIVVFQ